MGKLLKWVLKTSGDRVVRFSSGLLLTRYSNFQFRKRQRTWLGEQLLLKMNLLLGVTLVLVGHCSLPEACLICPTHFQIYLRCSRGWNKLIWSERKEFPRTLTPPCKVSGKVLIETISIRDGRWLASGRMKNHEPTPVIQKLLRDSKKINWQTFDQTWSNYRSFQKERLKKTSKRTITLTAAKKNM
jgi:hypothetical protein